MDILQAKIEQLPLSQLVPNEGQMESIGVHANPRQINEVDYAKLVESMRADNLTGVMPLKVFGFAGEWIVLGGNMRLRALQELGAETAPCIVVPADTDAATLNKIIITDNSTFGDWDMDALANWDEPLADWGVDLPIDEEAEKEEKGTLQFSEVLNEEHNYVVLYFDNEVDWLQAQTIFGIKPVLALSTRTDGKITKGNRRVGVGRVLNGAKAIEMLQK